ncbi:26722_t:CDS:1, partial [Gigaspora margarita]
RNKSLDIIGKNKSLNIIENETENKIKSQFLESDEINKRLSIIRENLKDIYISKAYNITEINRSLSKLKTSKTVVNIEVPDDQLTLCIY